eukprot:PITA_06723
MDGKVITCKAAVAWGPKQPFVIEEVQVDPPQAMEVRIRITQSSLCHTDITYWTISNEDAFPRIFGHEGAGIVESVGEGVTDLQKGDHVIPLYNGECEDCVYCKSKKTNLCVDYACVLKINPEVPLDIACLLGCGLATGLGAVWNIADIEPGSTVAIFGLGTVGLAVAEGARIRQASRIIGIDTNPNKFPKAKILGVTDCINPKDYEMPIEEVIRDMSNGGVDYGFECIGNTDILYQCFLATNDVWGLTVMLGYDSSPRKLSLLPTELFMGRRIVASIFGGFKGKSQLPNLIEKCANKEVQVKEFITHELPLADINKSFDLLLEGKSLRCVLHL